ncbi:MAG TPA: glutaminyl-peptide cyclotransferase [Terracidiphilus sp.]|jgi:glutaminyl-peptide cyclotransferase|nr:glutaminyl-peptide cyclotransferase [Terracidiphilus sp.]
MFRILVGRTLALLAFLAIALSCAYAADTYKIVQSFPHDSNAYTQGLLFLDGHLYESTGLNGRSSLRMVGLDTGRVLQTVPVPSQYFAEGLACWGSTLIQLTWQSHIAFVYDRFSFRLLRTMHYGGEGWGLTQDGKNLILSDGTATLRFLDPATFREVRRVVVKYNGTPITQLNELEYVRGEIYANVWHSDRIARIAPASGEVLGWIDLAGILPASQRSDPEAVLNGIAYDAEHNRLFVTGKLWPRLFEIKVIPQHASLVPANHSQ